MAPIVVLLAVLAFAFHRLLESPGSLVVDGRRPNVDHAERGPARVVGNDLTSVFLPRFYYVVRQLRATGKPPTWDASGFGGRPLVGNPQAGSYYPPLWAAWRVGSASALGWLTLGHLVWAGLGVYVLTRSLGFCRTAAAVAGVCYEVSPYLIAHTFEGHYPHVWAACWYPWAFWAFALCLRKDPVGFWSMPVVLAMTFLTGHPQEWYYLVIVLTTAACAVGLRSWRAGGYREGLSPVLIWAAVLGLSLGLSAVDWVPQLSAGAWSLKTGAIPLAQINRYRLHSLNLTQLLSPFALGGPQDYFGDDNYWETVLSIGLAPAVLAVIGALRGADRVTTRRWLILVVGATLFAAGKHLGLFTVAYTLLPGMDRFRVPARTLFLASLGASVLAGAGADRLLGTSMSDEEWERLRKRLRTLLLVTAAVVVSTSWLAPRVSAPPRPPSRPEPLWQANVPSSDRAGASLRAVQAIGSVASRPEFWLSLSGLFGVVALMTRGVGGRQLAGQALGAVAVLELTFYAQSLLICSPAGGFVGGDRIGLNIRESVGDRAAPVRIASFGTVYTDLHAARLGLEKTNINDGFQIQHAADLYECLYPLLDPSRPARHRGGAMDDVVDEYRGRVGQTVLDLMGVSYLISDRALPLPHFEPVLTAGVTGGRHVLWRNRTELPRAYVVPQVFPTSGTGRSLPVTLEDFEPRRGVFMDRDPLPAGRRQPFTAAEWVGRDPDEVVIRVQTEAPGLLVVGNTWMPGWSATVDGRGASVLRGNHWQQVVALPDAGRHEVVMRYVPPGLAAGSALSSTALFGWGAFGLALLARLLRAPRWEWAARPSRTAVLTAYRSA